MTNTVYYNDVINVSSGRFSVNLTGLAEGTTYYYEAFMKVHDGTGFVEITKGIGTFTTKTSASEGRAYLDCFEVPAVSVAGSLVDGNEPEGRGYKWYRHLLTSSKQAVATHTFQNGGQTIRNYTVLLDGNKKTPLWTAYAMHQSTWADNNAGRNDGWANDPAFQGVGDGNWEGTSALADPYNRGHLAASDERQTSRAMNKQTFYYSNQAPQNSSFNGGIWVQLEQKVKAAAPTGRDTLYVVTGVLFEGTAEYCNGIQVPSHFYKCLLKGSFDSSGKMTGAVGCAYVFTNEAKENNSASELPKYQTTISEIEGRAGFDFFPQIPSNLRSGAEDKATSLW